MDEDISKELRRDQIKNLNNEVSHIKRVLKQKGPTAATFTIKDKIIGGKKTSQEPIALKNPETNKQVKSAAEIKEVALSYCVRLLTNRLPKDEYREILILKEKLHQIRMKEFNDNDKYNTLTRKTYDETLHKLKKKSNKYSFILGAGASFKDTLYQIFKAI